MRPTHALALASLLLTSCAAASEPQGLSIADSGRPGDATSDVPGDRTETAPPADAPAAGPPESGDDAGTDVAVPDAAPEATADADASSDSSSSSDTSSPDAAVTSVKCRAWEFPDGGGSVKPTTLYECGGGKDPGVGVHIRWNLGPAWKACEEANYLDPIPFACKPASKPGAPDGEPCTIGLDTPPRAVSGYCE